MLQTVLTQRHAYEEIPWQDYRAQPGDPKQLPDQVFNPRFSGQGTSFDMSAVMSTKSSAEWPTTNPSTYSALIAEMATLAYCKAKACFSKADDAWLCSVIPTGTLVRQQGETAWWMVCGHQGSQDLSSLSQNGNGMC